MLSPRPRRLLQTVDELERQVDRASVAGKSLEREAWIADFSQSFRELETMVQLQRQLIHERLFSQIAKWDVPEADKLRELKEGDAQIEKLVELLKVRLLVLDIAPPQAAARLKEQQIEDRQILEFIDHALELIHWIRVQEETIDVAFAEAFVQSVTGSDVPASAEGVAL